MIVVENASSCVKNTLGAPAMTKRTFHLIVQCAAAFEMLCTAHLLVSNDLLFDVLIWSVLLKTLKFASNLSSNLPNKKLKKKKIHEILYVVRDAFIYVLAEFVR